MTLLNTKIVQNNNQYQNIMNLSKWDLLLHELELIPWFIKLKIVMPFETSHRDIFDIKNKLMYWSITTEIFGWNPKKKVLIKWYIEIKNEDLKKENDLLGAELLQKLTTPVGWVLKFGSWELNHDDNWKS